MRLQIDQDEAWALLSTVAKQVVDESALNDDDRAALRRWRADEMRPGRDAIKSLLDKINADLDRALKAKQRGAIQKHDWV